MCYFFTSPLCPLGHGKLRGYTVGSRLIVEASLVFLVAIYLAASLLNFGPSTSIAVAALLVLVLAGPVILDFSVLNIAARHPVKHSRADGLPTDICDERVRSSGQRRALLRHIDLWIFDAL